MKDLFFQSLFVEIENTHKLNTLKMNLDDLLEVSSEDFFPHISLFYGLKNKAVKQAVIDHLLTLPEYLVLDKITIAGAEVKFPYAIYQRFFPRCTGDCVPLRLCRHLCDTVNDFTVGCGTNWHRYPRN